MFWFKWFTLDFGTILSIENNSTTSHKICDFSETHKTCCCLINQEKFFFKSNQGKIWEDCRHFICIGGGGRWKRRGKDERTGQILKCDELNEFNPKLMKRHGTFLRDTCITCNAHTFVQCYSCTPWESTVYLPRTFTFLDVWICKTKAKRECVHVSNLCVWLICMHCNDLSLESWVFELWGFSISASARLSHSQIISGRWILYFMYVFSMV